MVEQLKIIGPLNDPTAYGGSQLDAFHLVVPVDAGLRVFRQTDHLGLGPAQIARAWVVLMRRLGYNKFVAQGGDWGAIIVDLMATQGHPELLGIHSNMPGVFSADIDNAAHAGALAPSGLSDDEKLAYERLAFVYAKGILRRQRDGSQASDALRDCRFLLAGIAGYFLDHDARSLAMISRAFDGQLRRADA